jgi:hypothetical protein
VLFKADAKLTVDDKIDRQDYTDGVKHHTFLWLVGIIAVCVVLINLGKTGEKAIEAKNSVAYSAPAKPAPAATAPMDKTRDILYKLNDGSTKDYNGDGLVNCIDYAVRFHREYGKGSRIIRNYNPDKGFNHLFNSVQLGGGQVVYIEPQRQYTFIMKDVWGDKYQSRYNEDETDIWTKKAQSWTW